MYRGCRNMQGIPGNGLRHHLVLHEELRQSSHVLVQGQHSDCLYKMDGVVALREIWISQFAQDLG
jgi:hypothetical protein